VYKLDLTGQETVLYSFPDVFQHNAMHLNQQFHFGPGERQGSRDSRAVLAAAVHPQNLRAFAEVEARFGCCIIRPR
jgi:hypothetical protein